MERIVVGVDGSDTSKDALRFALEEGELRGATVAVVHAWIAPDPPVGPMLPPPPIDWPGMTREVREAAERLVAELVDEVAGDRREAVRIETIVEEGAPAKVVLEHAERADLVIVGSRGLGGFARLLLGSVSEQVARHAPCPVLIYRRRSG
jgi:nucleotide-binding universal stress UspA family protein